jgi:DNA-binding NarL/FixJ family response regulator
MTNTRVLLVDDHQLVRAGFRGLLQTLRGVQVVGEASNGREALQLIRTLRPDVVLMDIGMTELNGLEATARIAKEFPHARVVILSMHADKEYVLKALRVGAAGYLLKDSDLIQLELAVRAAANGEKFLSPAVSKYVISDYISRMAVVAESGDEEELTARQREILQLIAEGHTKQEIARSLNISPKTVETHREQIMARLDIHDVAGLVRYAIKIGLVGASV